MLSFQTLLQLLLTEHSMLPPQGLLKRRLGLQGLLVTQHRVVVLPEHLIHSDRREDIVITDVAEVKHRVISNRNHTGTRDVNRLGVSGYVQNIINSGNFIHILHGS